MAARKKNLRFASAAALSSFLAAEAAAEGHRMVARGSVVNDAAPEPHPEPPSDDAPVSHAQGVWGPKPSVTDQLIKQPATVRFKDPESHQFVLSDKGQMAAWNKLQSRLYPPGAPELKLDVYEHIFAPSMGSFVILATCTAIEYQQL